MNCIKGFFKNTAEDMIAGIIIAIVILSIAVVTALADQQTKPLRDFRGEQHIFAEQRHE